MGLLAVWCEFAQTIFYYPALLAFVAGTLAYVINPGLRRSQPDHPRGYRAPALGLLGLLGAVSSVAALVIGFVLPSQFGHANPLVYAALILAGILTVGILPPLLLDRLRKPGWKATGSASAPQL